jgi:hypothetical protein
VQVVINGVLTKVAFQSQGYLGTGLENRLTDLTFDFKKIKTENKLDLEQSKTIYEDFIPLDSGIESRCAQNCETSEQIKFYFELPN